MIFRYKRDDSSPKIKPLLPKIKFICPHHIIMVTDKLFISKKNNH
jgi:hypothetical protein